MAADISEDLLDEHPAPWGPIARDDAAEGMRALDRLAGSTAQFQLAREIKRYARGEVSGRAFLIAGHRGAGKTTAVLAAMQRVYNECQNSADPRLRSCRPLLVRLHAPSLVIDGEPAASASAQPASVTGGGAPSGGPQPARLEQAWHHSQRFLQEMAAGIFPALIDEVRRCLHQRMQKQPDKPGNAPQKTADAEAELIAHLCDELSRGMPLAELRELIRRLGLLENGGLLCKTDAFQELVAINNASEAYLIVTGKLTTEASTGRKDEQSHESKLDYGLVGDQLVKALTPVSVAAAAAFGLATDHPIAGLVVAFGILLSGLSFTHSNTRTRTRSAARSRSFAQDHTLQSLIRRVPLLIEQLREVGFPPIFVLDELDKVKSADKLLEWLMTNLKSYVTERSFLCFVVERGYYQSFATARRNGDAKDEHYPIASTFYSDMAYVISPAHALHDYIRVMLRENDPSFGNGAALLKTSVQHLDLARLRHVILHRARAHAYDVQRELRKAVESGELRGIPAAGSAFRPPPAWTYRAFFQLAIEWVMSEARLRRRSREDPFYLQVQYDLLYGISDDWQKQAEIDADPPQVAARVTMALGNAAADQAMARALSCLLDFLQQPSAMLEEVQNEIDLERLEVFLRDDEGPKDERHAEGVLKGLKDKLAGRNRKRLAACFSTQKYRLLEYITRELAEGMLEGPPMLSWRVDPWGESRSQAILDDAKRAAIAQFEELCGKIRALPIVQGLDLSKLWAVAAPALRVESLAETLRRLDESSANSSDKEFVERIAVETPAIAAAAKVLIVGVAVVKAIKQWRKEESATPVGETVSLLGHAVIGSTTADRWASAAELVRTLIERHHLQTPDAAKRALEVGQDMDGQRTLDAGDLEELTGLVVGAGSPDMVLVRIDWQESLARRVLASVDDSVVPYDEAGRQLDVIAMIHDWFPSSLATLWTRWSQPKEWPVYVYSELLADGAENEQAGVAARETLTWLHLFAAARLGVKPRITSPSPLGQFGEAVASYARAAIARMPDHPLRVLLVNVDKIMLDWLPLPEATCLSIRIGAEWTRGGQDAASFDLVFVEGDLQRPEFLEPDQYVVVMPVPTTLTQRVTRRSDGGITLFGPTSLEEAIEWLPLEPT